MLFCVGAKKIHKQANSCPAHFFACSEDKVNKSVKPDTFFVCDTLIKTEYDITSMESPPI